MAWMQISESDVPLEYHIEAIHRGRREVLLKGGAVVPMSSLRDEDGDEIDYIDDDGYFVVELPNGMLAKHRFSQFPANQMRLN